MKPHSLRSSGISYTASKAELRAKLGPHARRFAPYEKGTKLPETQVVACPRVKMEDLPIGFIPARYYESNLEHNQLVKSCCRHPENHEIEARKSHPEEELPDIYVFYCTCGRKHVRWFLCETDKEPRPMWDAS